MVKVEYGNYCNYFKYMELRTFFVKIVLSNDYERISEFLSLNFTLKVKCMLKILQTLLRKYIFHHF